MRLPVAAPIQAYSPRKASENRGYAHASSQCRRHDKAARYREEKDLKKPSRLGQYSTTKRKSRRRDRSTCPLVSSNGGKTIKDRRLTCRTRPSWPCERDWRSERCQFHSSLP